MFNQNTHSISISRIEETLQSRLDSKILSLMKQTIQDQSILDHKISVEFQLPRRHANNLATYRLESSNITMRGILRATELTPVEEAEIFDSKIQRPKEYYNESVSIHASGTVESLFTFLAIYQRRAEMLGYSEVRRANDWLDKIILK